MLWFRTRKSRREDAGLLEQYVTWNTTMHMGGVWRTGGILHYFQEAVKIPEKLDEDIWLDQVV
jgi:hypothetical protein